MNVDYSKVLFEAYEDLRNLFTSISNSDASEGNYRRFGEELATILGKISFKTSYSKVVYMSLEDGKPTLWDDQVPGSTAMVAKIVRNRIVSVLQRG